MRHEAEDYVDRKLAAFEVVLDRTMQQVQKGRERLQVHVAADEAARGADADEAGGFFDQDESLSPTCIDAGRPACDRRDGC